MKYRCLDEDIFEGKQFASLSKNVATVVHVDYARCQTSKNPAKAILKNICRDRTYYYMALYRECTKNSVQVVHPGYWL